MPFENRLPIFWQSTGKFNEIDKNCELHYSSLHLLKSSPIMAKSETI